MWSLNEENGCCLDHPSFDSPKDALLKKCNDISTKYCSFLWKRCSEKIEIDYCCKSWPN
uniref:Uncharacterized protein n=1 Tax=Lepeophtheirus salmonis TaxID=72036 RepID=A0A0K2V2Z4_LEPSM